MFKNVFKAVSVTFIPVAILTTALFFAASEHNNIANSTVMVTRNDGRSGGTGVILNSHNSFSEILTNGHVCEVVKNGGLVTTTKGESHSVTGYKASNEHDLCMISVSANLQTQTNLASNSPNPYEHAYVSGHPHLYPNVVTEGHFSGEKIIEVMMGFKDCTEQDYADPGKAVVCGALGKLPQIKRFETQLVTATIMPGSSGSGVYNSNKLLSGLVFAGAGDLSYAFIVPYNYVYNFVNDESKTLEYEKPNTQLSIYEILGNAKNIEEEVNKIKRVCTTNTNVEVQKVCELMKRDMIYSKDRIGYGNP